MSSPEEYRAMWIDRDLVIARPRDRSGLDHVVIAPVIGGTTTT
jgi:hypothetical protein